MKITGIRIHHIEWERGPYHWRDEIMPSGSTARTALLRIITDAGIEGWSSYSAGASVEEIKYQIVGEDPLNRERIWQKFWRNLRTSKLGLAIGPVDCALWDLAGKVQGEPVYKLAGGMRDKVPAYASTVTLDSLDEYMALARRCLEKGYRAIKLHAWGRLKEDAELCRALRKEVGDEIVLMYDASSMFNLYEDAVWFGRRLEEQDFLWYEEPMDHFNMVALARLARELDIPLAVAEATHGGPWDALAQIQAGAADIILTGPLDPYKGGLTGVLKTAHICEGYGMMCAIHGGAISHLHAACAIYNTKYFERLVPETYYSPPGIRDASTEIGADGYARPWDKPGLGFEVDWGWVEAHTVGIEE
ncbi:MAG: racemase [Anaerolineae bacterium]|jgi:L-alanine-DL-glutamate epimerase-like enolase superfamily enzyme|nr:racemase [Anaerolineae bacterium]